jgi:hypothetical protein
MTYSNQLLMANNTMQSHFFLQGSAENLFASELIHSKFWHEFARSWQNLHQDTFMADGGKYRFRRYSEFSLDPVNKQITTLDHVPYRQTKKNNYLNGDIDRLYSPMKEEIQTNEAFRQVLLTCADVILQLQDSEEWLVQVFQNRIIASNESLGKPTPEGVHRDGVDFVLSLMIKYHNIGGGESSAYAEDGTSLKAKITLKEPGDFILLDDAFMKHSVEPIFRINPNEEGYRDVLIAMFTKRMRTSTLVI